MPISPTQPAPAPPVHIKRRPLYQQMTEDLQGRIGRGELKPGLPAPSESELIAEFGVSSTTARRCLNELARSGLVYRVQGRGTFVSEFAQASAVRQIGIFYHDLINLTDGFVSNALRGINDVLSGNGVQPALLTLGGVAQSHNPAATLRSLVQRHELGGLLILSPIPPKWLGPTLDLGLPVAAVNFAYPDPRIRCVLADHQSAVSRLLARVEAAGHRRGVAFRGHFDPTLVEGVAMTRLKLPKAGAIDWTVENFRYFTPGVVAQLATDHLARKNPPTVFFCFGYDAATEVAAAVRDRGWSIPDDLSIVFVGSPPHPTQFTGELPPVTRMSAEAATYLVDGLAGGVPSAVNPAPLDMLTHDGTTLRHVPGS